MSRIKEYDPKIYPRRVWIQLGTESPEGFTGVSKFEDYNMAVVNTVTNKVTNKSGFLIRFASKEDMDMNTIAHESLHVAMEILNYCDVTFDFNHQEALCYLTGWVAECCQDLLQEVNKEDGGK